MESISQVTEISEGTADILSKVSEISDEREEDADISDDNMAAMIQLAQDVQGHSLAALYIRANIPLMQTMAASKTSFGAGIADIIQCGLRVPASRVGLYASDPDAYHCFRDLFQYVIHHLILDPSPIPSLIQNTNPDLEEWDPLQASRLIKSVRVRFARNFSGYSFASMIDKESRLRVEQSVVIPILSSLPSELQGQYHPLPDLSPLTQQQWRDQHLLFSDEDRFMSECGFYRDWPSGRGVFLSQDATSQIWVNEEDHIRVISLDRGHDLLKAFSRANQLLEHLSSRQKFAYDPEFGWLTSCPTNTGTGMRASVHIELPQLCRVRKLAGLKQLCRNLKLELRASHGESTSLAETDHIFDVSNARRFGVSTAACISDVIRGCGLLLTMEHDLKNDQSQ